MAKARTPADELFRADGRIRLEIFTDRAARALRAALDFAKQTGWDALRSPHVFMGLLAEADQPIRVWAEQADLNLRKLLAQFVEWFTEDQSEAAALALHREFISDNLIRLLRKSRLRAAKQRRAKLTSIDLLHTLLSVRTSVVAECLRRTGQSPEKLARWATEAERLG